MSKLTLSEFYSKKMTWHKEDKATSGTSRHRGGGKCLSVISYGGKCLVASRAPQLLSTDVAPPHLFRLSLPREVLLAIPYGGMTCITFCSSRQVFSDNKRQRGLVLTIWFSRGLYFLKIDVKWYMTPPIRESSKCQWYMSILTAKVRIPWRLNFVNSQTCVIFWLLKRNPSKVGYVRGAEMFNNHVMW